MEIKLVVGEVVKVINLNEEDVSEFKLKFESVGGEKSLEDFIVNDISSLIENEIDDGLFGLFNY